MRPSNTFYIFAIASLLFLVILLIAPIRHYQYNNVCHNQSKVSLQNLNKEKKEIVPYDSI